MVSLVSTVLNDRCGLETFFAAISAQTRTPDEIIIVVAGSKDGTWELMQSEAERRDRPWSFRAIQEPHCNVARGRNLAIRHASGDIIVSTDIGCSWDAGWLEELVSPLEVRTEIELVNGSWAVFRNDLRTPWALTEWALMGEQKLDATPESSSSSRSIAYRKSTWEHLGGYPEDLTLAADDAVFALLIERADVRRAGAPIVRCYWQRHSDLTGFLKESRRYGIGDGEAAIRIKDMILIGGRLAFEVLGIACGLLALLPMMPGSPWLGFSILASALISVAFKVFKMRGAVRRLAATGTSHPLLRILALSYGTKWERLRGYTTGVWRGYFHCHETRRRLREMSPQLYRVAQDASAIHTKSPSCH